LHVVIPRERDLKGAEILVKMLINYGVKRVFGVPGGQTLPIYEAIYDHRDQISHLLFREEANAVFAADAYARITNKVGIADATLGPGVFRAVPAVAESYGASTPLILLMGNNPITWLPITTYRANASQAFDQMEVLRPITKWVGQITSAKNIPPVIRFAFRAATSGRPGPVAVDVPSNVLTDDVEAKTSDLYAQGEFSKVPALRVAPDPEKIARVANLIRASERPLIIAGGGVHISNASHELYKLAVTFGIPVATTLNGKGAFPEVHPLSLGVLSSLGGWVTAERAAKIADLLIFIGSNVDQFTTINWRLPLEGQKVVHIDIDPVELGRSFVCEVAIEGDAKASLEALYAKLVDVDYKPKADWIEEVLKLKKEVLDPLEYVRDAEGNKRLSVKRVMKIIDEFFASRRNVIVASDASSSSGWVAGCITAREPGRKILIPRGAAGLGYAIPACIGAAMGARDSGIEPRCVAIAGDGGAAYSIVEVETARRYDVPLIAIILNDCALGWIKKDQEKMSGKVYSSEFTEVDFAAIAKGLNARGFTIWSYEDLRWALDDCFNENMPCVIDVKVETASPYAFLYS
jgi:acetolactate synthase-1/2/3 large subunit